MNTATKVFRIVARQRPSACLPRANAYAYRHSNAFVGLVTVRAMHSSHNSQAKPRNPSPREHPADDYKPRIDENIGQKRFGDFDVAGKVFIVTGGAQGLGLAMAEALVEAGGKGKRTHARARARMSTTDDENADVLPTNDSLRSGPSLRAKLAMG